MKSTKLLSGNAFDGWRPPFKTREDVLIRIMAWVEETKILLGLAMANFCESYASLKPAHFASMGEYAKYVSDQTELPTKVVMPPAELAAGKRAIVSVAKDDQVKCLYVVSELLVKHRMLLEYIIPIDMHRNGLTHRSTLNSPHDCRLLAESDGHFICQIRAALNRLCKIIHMLRSLTGDCRPVEKTPDIRHTRFAGTSGQRYTLAVVYKSRDLLTRVKTVLEQLRMGVNIGDSLVEAPCALYAYSLTGEERHDTVGEVVVPSCEKPTQALAVPFQQLEKKVKKLRPKYPIERGAYGVLPQLFGGTIPCDVESPDVSLPASCEISPRDPLDTVRLSLPFQENTDNLSKTSVQLADQRDTSTTFVGEPSATDVPDVVSPDASMTRATKKSKTKGAAPQLDVPGTEKQTTSKKVSKQDAKKAAAKGKARGEKLSKKPSTHASRNSSEEDVYGIHPVPSSVCPSVEKFPSVYIKAPLQLTSSGSYQGDETLEEDAVNKVTRYVHGPEQVLFLGRNRYTDENNKRIFPPLIKDFATPGVGTYSPYEPSLAPAYTMGQKLPTVTLAETPGFSYVNTSAIGSKYKNRSKELSKHMRADVARKKKLLVGEWYAYQRRHKYFPCKFDHFASNRIIKQRVIRYPPNVDYHSIAYAFPERAMPCAPCHLPVIVKTLVLP